LVDSEAARAIQLAAAVEAAHPGVASFGIRAGDEHPGEYDMIVNCAPPSENSLPVDVSQVPPGALIVDIVLKPAWTPLLAKAAACGLATHAGVHMLAGQVEAVMAFFGLPPGSVNR
jgi:shikimate dehydrogenase